QKLPSERKGKEVERDVRNNFLTESWASKPIVEITDLDLLAVLNEKRATAPSQARNLLGILKRFFAWAIDQRVYGITVSPCATLKAKSLFGRKKRRRRVLDDPEIFAFWRNVKRMRYPYGPAYKLLILTPLRLNAAVDIALTEIKHGENLIHIPA